MKIVIAAQNVLTDGRARVDLEKRGLPVQEIPPGELAATCPGDVTVLVVGSNRVDTALLDRSPALRYVLRTGAGLDNIDVDACRARGIRVDALPGMNAESVADFTFGLVLALARRIVESAVDTWAGHWQPLAGGEVHGRTIGIVGNGHVGAAVARRAGGFGMTTLVVDRGGDLDDLLRRSDVVTLHVPLTPETRGLVGRRELALMRPGAYLVNTARGGLVDEAALYDALTSGALAGAALDVFATEPPTSSPLLELPSVIATPHAASYGADTLARIGLAVTERVVAFLEEGS